MFRKALGYSTAIGALSLPLLGQASGESEGLLPVPDYSGDWRARSRLTGDWAGLRSMWADGGFTAELDWYQAFQGVPDGGLSEGSASSTNLDYRLTLDLMRMGVPGALVTVRAQSVFGDAVNAETGLLLPVNTYSAFPISTDADGDVGFAITEFYWAQYLADQLAVAGGKVTTLGTANEFLGGEGRTQFMNFQLAFPPVLAQLVPYSTLAVATQLTPIPLWTLTCAVMNLEDASTTSGFDDIGDGTTLAIGLDYVRLSELPGGGSLNYYRTLGGEVAAIGGLNLDPGGGANPGGRSDAWAFSWSEWQYVLVEGEVGPVDPRDGQQDLQGLGLFAQVGVGDEDTNPISGSFAGGISGRGSIPGRDADTWGFGYFYSKLQDLELGSPVLEDSVRGFEVYYDIALTGSASLTLNAQWVQSAFTGVDDATILGVRLNVSF